MSDKIRTETGIVLHLEKVKAEAKHLKLVNPVLGLCFIITA